MNLELRRRNKLRHESWGTDVCIKMTVFWYMTPCRLIDRYQHFEGPDASSNIFYPEDGGSMLLRSVSNSYKTAYRVYSQVHSSHICRIPKSRTKIQFCTKQEIGKPLWMNPVCQWQVLTNSPRCENLVFILYRNTFLCAGLSGNVDIPIGWTAYFWVGLVLDYPSRSTSCQQESWTEFDSCPYTFITWRFSRLARRVY
jgi:hypothetical protein